MLAQTADLADAIRQTGSALANQVSRLDGAYAGAECVILTCGPSLADHDPERLRSALTGKLVIAIKQAVAVAGTQADFLCFNAYNASRYDVASVDTIRVYCEDAGRSVVQRNAYDVRFQQAPHAGDLGSSLAATLEYEDAMISRSLIRPWGPGILHEVAFPLAVHLGVSEITTIGWDIANERGNNVHFYDTADNDFFDRGRADAHAMAGLRGRIPPTAKRALREVRSRAKHRRGGVYNKTTMIAGEAELVAASTPALQSWLADHGVTLRVVSDHSLVSPEVPRVSAEAFYVSS